MARATSTCVVFPSKSAGVEVDEEIFAVLLGAAFRSRNYSFIVYLMKVRAVLKAQGLLPVYV